MADRIRATGSTRSDTRHGGELVCELTASCGLALAGQDDACLGLEDGNKVVCHEIRFVLTPLLRGEFTFVAFICKFADAGLRLAVSLHREQFPRGLHVEGGADRLENAVQ